jgi:predicted amidohydrolase
MADPTDTIIAAAGQIEARLMNEAPATLAAIDAAITRAAHLRVQLLVLPECAYPAYLLGSVTSYRAGDHLSGEQFVEWLSERAARFRLHIISGFVEDTGQCLHNAAVLIDDHGREIGRSRKRFLWNADHDWFAPGNDIRAFDTALGRIGVAICAEARVPEVFATLVADGAELIALPTCWINAAREPGQFYNPQVDFLIEARAREFGVPLVCADKSGLELGAVGYVGQSRIVRADGTTAAEAPATGGAVIAARVSRGRPRRVWLTEARREALLARREPAPAGDGASRRFRVAAMPGAVANTRYTGGMGESLFEPLARQDVKLLLARAFDIHALGFPTETKVFRLGPARVGCVAGQWVRSFAAARHLALDGAEILLVFDAPADMALLRARALENRVFAMAVADRWAAIIGPDGEIRARTDESNLTEAVAEIDLAEAGDKFVAPRTHIFAERRVDLYRF